MTPRARDVRKRLVPTRTLLASRGDAVLGVPRPSEHPAHVSAVVGELVDYEFATGNVIDDAVDSVRREFTRRYIVNGVEEGLRAVAKLLLSTLNVFGGPKP